VLREIWPGQHRQATPVLSWPAAGTGWTPPAGARYNGTQGSWHRAGFDTHAITRSLSRHISDTPRYVQENPEASGPWPFWGVIIDQFARADVIQVLSRYGISAARRAADTDSSEEIILISESLYKQVDVESLTRALMDVLPHIKVWVAPDNPRWSSEPI